MKTTIVVVNRHRLRANKKNGTNDPVFRCSIGKYGNPWYAHDVVFDKPGKLVYDPEHPLPCGATVWFEVCT
jgi:hypothetical protein